MSSISGSSRAQSRAGADTRVKTKSRTGSKVAAGSRSGHEPSSSASHLLAIRDELDELAGLVAMLPQLHRFIGVMEEIIGPRDGHDASPARDPIGSFLTGMPRRQQVAVREAVDRLGSEAVDLADLMDMKSALEAMTRSIEYRMHRACALLGRK